MEDLKTNRAFLQKKDLFIAGLGMLFLVASALDPGGTRLPPAVRVGLLCMGVALMGWLVARVVFASTPSSAATDKKDADGRDLFKEHKKTLLGILFVIHVTATFFFFPPGDIFNTKPVVTLDHSFHYYQVRRANEVFLSTGRLHAYDPYFMAGYPSAIFDLDVKGAEIFCSVVPAGAVASAMKVFILVCYLTMVFTVYLGCRFLGLTERESILGLMLLLVYWHWGRPYASHFRFAGMFGFVGISHLSILVVGLFGRFLRGKGIVWFFVLGSIAFFVHPTAIVILSLPFVVLAVLERARLTFKKSLAFFGWCIAVILVNAVWIIPLLRYAHTKSPSEEFFQTSGAFGLSCILIQQSCFPAVALVVLSVFGIWWLGRQRRTLPTVVLSLTAAFLLFVSAYGIHLPGLKQLEPGRFLLPALFFAAPLAGCGAVLLLDWFERVVKGVLARTMLERLAVIVLAVSPIVLSYLSATTGYKHRLSTTLDSELKELIEAVKTHAGPSGRLMIEDGPAALYGNVHLPGLLPAYTGVEQIGGPYPFTFIEHHFATFQRDKMVGKPLREVTQAEFRAYVDLYNIRWILTAARETRDYVSRTTSDSEDGLKDGMARGAVAARVIWESPRYTLWQVDRPGTFTGGENDRVRSSFNRIEIELGAAREFILLKYHWDYGLTVSPPATMIPVRQLDDPVPFVFLEPNGASSIVINY